MHVNVRVLLRQTECAVPDETQQGASKYVVWDVLAFQRIEQLFDCGVESLVDDSLVGAALARALLVLVGDSDSVGDGGVGVGGHRRRR